MTERLHINLGGRSIVVEYSGGPVKITVDGKVYVDERAQRTKKPKATRAETRERAAAKFIVQAAPLIAPPLTPALQSYWRGRVNAMADFIRSGHALGSKSDRDRLIRELCGVVAACTRSADGAASKARALPWYAPILGLRTWPVTAAALKAAYRKLALERHPDHGGTHAAFVELQKAHDAAKAALGVA